MNGKEKEKKTDCPCSWPCERHGDCEACKAYHHGQGQKTACEKLPERL